VDGSAILSALQAWRKLQRYETNLGYVRLENMLHFVN
jgi:hypothetical protein